MRVYLFVSYDADDSGTGACCIYRVLRSDIGGEEGEASHTPVIIALREYASCMLRKDTAFVPQVSWADEEGVATLALIRPIWSAGWFNKLHGMRAPFIPCISRPSKKQVHLYRLTESYNVWSAPSLKTYNPRTIVQTYSWKCRCVCVCVRERGLLFLYVYGANS